MPLSMPMYPHPYTPTPPTPPHPYTYIYAHAQLIRVIKLFGLDRSRGEEEKMARTILDTVLEMNNNGCSKNSSTTWSEYFCILVPAHFRILACILAAYSSILDCITSSSAVSVR